MKGIGLEMSDLSVLPIPLLRDILLQVSYTDIGALVQTCTQFGAIIKDQTFWRSKLGQETDENHRIIFTKKKKRRRGSDRINPDAQDKRKEYLKLCLQTTKNYIPGMDHITNSFDCLIRVIREGNLTLTQKFVQLCIQEEYGDYLKNEPFYTAIKYNRVNIYKYLAAICAASHKSYLKGLARGGFLAQLKRRLDPYLVNFNPDDQYYSDASESDEDEEADSKINAEDDDILNRDFDLAKDLVIKAIKNGNLELYKYTFLYCLRTIRGLTGFADRNGGEDRFDLYGVSKYEVLRDFIHAAAKYDRAQIVDEIMQQSKSLHADHLIQHIRNEGLSGAASGGNVNIYRELFTPDSTGKEHHLFLACSCEHTEMVEELFKDPEIFKGNSWTPGLVFHYICRDGGLNPIIILLEAFDKAGLATPEVFSRGVLTCFEENKVDILQFLISQIDIRYSKDVIKQIYLSSVEKCLPQHKTPCYRMLMERLAL